MPSNSALRIWIALKVLWLAFGAEVQRLTMALTSDPWQQFPLNISWRATGKRLDRITSNDPDLISLVFEKRLKTVDKHLKGIVCNCTFWNFLSFGHWKCHLGIFGDSWHFRYWRVPHHPELAIFSLHLSALQSVKQWWNLRLDHLMSRVHSSSPHCCYGFQGAEPDHPNADVTSSSSVHCNEQQQQREIGEQSDWFTGPLFLHDTSWNKGTRGLNDHLHLNRALLDVVSRRDSKPGAWLRLTTPSVTTLWRSA